MIRTALVLFVLACGGAPRPLPAMPWPVPAGWRSEVIPFPLDFAPSIAHLGVEDLRFAPGFFDPGAPGYWSYAFAWHTDDAAELDAAELGAELAAYFAGLIDAVDKDHRITERDQIAVTARPAGPGGFTLAARVFDAFKTAQPLDLTGTAERRACPVGALWVFVLAPAASTLRPQLEALAREATCVRPSRSK